MKTFRKSTISGEKPSEDLVFGISETVKTSWHRARTEAGLLHVTFNVLRHTAATRLGESTQLGIVGKVLGHSNPKTTWRYFNPDDEQIGQAGTILEEWQRNHPPPASVEVEIANDSEAVN